MGFDRGGGSVVGRNAACQGCRLGVGGCRSGGDSGEGHGVGTAASAGNRGAGATGSPPSGSGPGSDDFTVGLLSESLEVAGPVGLGTTGEGELLDDGGLGAGGARGGGGAVARVVG